LAYYALLRVAFYLQGEYNHSNTMQYVASRRKGNISHALHKQRTLLFGVVHRSKETMYNFYTSGSVGRFQCLNSIFNSIKKITLILNLSSNNGDLVLILYLTLCRLYSMLKCNM